jgi:hypothetical protein
MERTFRVFRACLEAFDFPKIFRPLEYGGSYAGAYLLRRGLFSLGNFRKSSTGSSYGKAGKS